MHPAFFLQPRELAPDVDIRWCDILPDDDLPALASALRATQQRRRSELVMGERVDRDVNRGRIVAAGLAAWLVLLTTGLLLLR